MKKLLKNAFRLGLAANAFASVAAALATTALATTALATTALATTATATERSHAVTVKKITATQDSPNVKIIFGDQQISVDVDRAVEEGMGALTQALSTIDDKTLSSLSTHLQDLLASVSTGATGVRENAERVREAARAGAEAARVAADKARATAESIDVNEIRETIRRAKRASSNKCSAMARSSRDRAHVCSRATAKAVCGKSFVNQTARHGFTSTTPSQSVRISSIRKSVLRVLHDSTKMQSMIASNKCAAIGNRLGFRFRPAVAAFR
jgi:hypothetical protein